MPSGHNSLPFLGRMPNARLSAYRIVLVSGGKMSVIYSQDRISVDLATEIEA